MVSGKALSHGGIEEQRLRGDIRVEGQVGAELGLDEGIAPKHLVKGGKRFKCSRAAAEAALPVSGGDEKSSLQAENRTATQVGEHDALEGEGHVPKASMPD